MLLLTNQVQWARLITIVIDFLLERTGMVKPFIYERIKHLIGQKFGSYTVLDFAEHRYNGELFLLCRCDCKVEKPISKQKLLSGRITRCVTCGVTDANKKRTKHGMINTSTYNIWRSMRRRCIDAKKKSYNRYGGRGITVCRRWDSFENFLADMGERPDGCQIDRINNDGNYEPSNCRWVTPKVNANNRSNNKKEDCNVVS